MRYADVDEFACFHCVCVGYLLQVLWLLPWSKDIRDDSKFVAVNVSMNGGLSLCVRPAIDWQPLQGVVCSFPYDYWDRLHPSHDPDVDKKMEVFCGIL